MRVVHCCREICTHYCGRSSSKHKALGKPNDLSILCNPEYLKDESQRDAVCERYESYLSSFIQRNVFIKSIICELPADAILGCFCFPRRCHCDSIIKFNKYFKDEIRLRM